MITDIRWIERTVEINKYLAKTERILQAYDGHVWFDVPVEAVPETEER